MMPANHDRLSLAQLRGLAPLPPKKLTEKEWVEKEMEAMTRGDVAGTCSICMEELGERFRGAKDEAGREERKTRQCARSEATKTAIQLQHDISLSSCATSPVRLASLVALRNVDVQG